MSSVIIRLAQASDTEKMLDIYTPFILNSPTTFEYEIPSTDAFYDRVSQTLTFAPWLVCEAENQMAGYAYAGKHRSRPAYQWSVELSVYVHAHFQRKGIAKGLYTSLMALLKLQGYYSAYAGITLPNPASIGFHEHFGFSSVGIYHQVGYKLGTWHDVGWWEKAIQHKIKTPLPTKTLAEAQKLSKWAEALHSGLPCIKI